MASAAGSSTSPPPLPPPPASAAPNSPSSSASVKRKRPSDKLPPYDPAIHKLVAPSTGGGREKGSPCWSVFRLVDNDPAFADFALCTLCKRWFTRKNGSTSSLNSHVRRTHPEIVIGSDDDGDDAEDGRDDQPDSAAKKARVDAGGNGDAAAAAFTSSSSSHSSSPPTLPLDAVKLLLDYRFNPDNAAVWSNTEPHALQAAWSTLARAMKLNFDVECTRQQLEDVCNRQLDGYRKHVARGGPKTSRHMPPLFLLMDQFMSAPSAAQQPQSQYSRVAQEQEERKVSRVLPLSRLGAAEAEAKDSGSKDGGSSNAAVVREVRQMLRAHKRVLERLAADNRHFLLQMASFLFPDTDLEELERKFGRRAEAAEDEEKEQRADDD